MSLMPRLISTLQAQVEKLVKRLRLTNAAIQQELSKLGDKPLIQAFLLPFVEINEKALAPAQEGRDQSWHEGHLAPIPLTEQEDK